MSASLKAMRAAKGTKATTSGSASGERPPVAGRGNHVVLASLIGVLTIIGLVMVLSASSVQSEREFDSTWSYFVRQSAWVAIGLVGLLVAYRLDYRRWRRLAVPFVWLCLFLLLVVLIPSVGVEVNGARSWLGFGPMRMQPAELAKLALLVFSAQLLARRSHRLGHWRLGLLPVCVVAGVIAALVMAQPDLGTAIVLASITFSVLFVAGVPLLPLTGVALLAGAGALVLALSETYRRNRILAFLDPARDPQGIAFQLNQSFMGIASGGWTGLGLGESRAKWGFLPNAHTDFIFAIIAEEVGLIGALVVVGLFLAFGYYGIRTALAAPDRFGTLVAAGITAWILSQAFVNVGGVVGILPITGLTLPFISFGGTSLLITMTATGILLNIARQGAARPSGGASAPGRERAPQMA